jgi:hypothetical protein
MQLSLLDSDESTSSLEDSPARTSAQQESERASRALDPASGPKLSELSLRHDRLGACLRMSLGLELSARTGCSLTWQRQDTPHGRSWWVLSMPERRTDDSACGLLPTPTAQDSAASRNRTVTRPDGCKHHDGVTLTDAVWMGMLPTPTQRDWRSGEASEETLNRNARPLNEVVISQTGAAGTTRLNPQFVAWMMGYPPDWLEGVECKPSKPSATP